MKCNEMKNSNNVQRKKETRCASLVSTLQEMITYINQARKNRISTNMKNMNYHEFGSRKHENGMIFHDSGAIACIFAIYQLLQINF